MENNTEEQLSQLTDEQLFELRAELLKGLDDDLASGTCEPKTMAMTDRLAAKLPNRLLEEDNGFFDFHSPLTEDSLQAVMADLRINFSREKLAFACKVIAALNAGKPQMTIPAPKPTSPASDALLPESTASAPALQQQESVPAPKPAPDVKGTMPPRPPKPNAEPPKGWSGASGNTGRNAPPTHSRLGGGRMPQRKPGFWERLFGGVGRRIDEFFQRLFG